MTLEDYAALMAELAAAGEARAAVLARHDLDEEGDGVSELLSRHAAAYESAQRQSAPPISVEQLAHVTRRLQASGDLRASLSKEGVTLAEYVRGTEHWSRLLATDPEAERRFNEVLRGG